MSLNTESGPSDPAGSRNPLDVLGDLIDLTPDQQRQRLSELVVGDAERLQLAQWLAAPRAAVELLDVAPPQVLKLMGNGDALPETTGREDDLPVVGAVPITEYCEKNILTLRERLELFLGFCRVVQRAHKTHVIHGNINPSNLLVSVQGGVPVPSITDFEVAAGGAASESEMLTQSGECPITPEYLSPEQILPGSVKLDARTDVYSLGAVLYELLTGVTPLDRQQLRAATPQQLGAIIRRIAPPCPSERLSAAAKPLLEPGREPATQAVGIDLTRIARSLRGELDWIVMCCLQKDRAGRYATAADLAADVERYLSGRRPSAIQKLLRRVPKLFWFIGCR